METPKVACSTVKRTMQAAELGIQESELKFGTHDKAKSPLSGFSQSPELLKRAMKGELKSFAFVRNPYSRVLSCYIDKIVTNEWERARHLPALGFEKGSDVSFEEFLEVIVEQKVSEMDIHWCPQTELLAPDHIPYDFIGRFETFSYDLNKVLNNFYSATVEVTNVDFHKSNAVDKLKKYYTPKAIDMVKHLYKDDFERFCYSSILEFC